MHPRTIDTGAPPLDLSLDDVIGAENGTELAIDLQQRSARLSSDRCIKFRPSDPDEALQLSRLVRCLVNYHVAAGRTAGPLAKQHENNRNAVMFGLRAALVVHAKHWPLALHLALSGIANKQGNT